MIDTNPDTFLAHHGVKGQKWGVIRDDTSSGDKTTTEEYKKLLPKKVFTEKQKEQNRVEMAKAFIKKAEPSNAEEPRLSPGQKKALYIGMGVLGTAAIAGGAYYLHQKGIKLPGKALSPAELYNEHFKNAELDIWGQLRHIHPTSFDRPEFTLPAGQVFKRYSLGVETTFKKYTYASFEPNDIARYASFFGSPTGAEITFAAKTPLKVPNLTTALETLRESLTESQGRPYTAKEALDKYSFFTKDNWHGNQVEDFFNALKAKGYGALVDDLDAGVMSDRPLLIFGHEQMTEKVSSPITEEMIREAAKLIVPLRDPKT